MNELRHYLTADGRDLMTEWLENLDIKTRARISRRFNRFAFDLFGDCKAVGGGIFEAREDFGPGYRIYFSRVGKTIILLICGGDKSSQKVDIERAKAYLSDFKAREKMK